MTGSSSYILLAEDNSGDVFLVKQSLAHHKIPNRLVVFSDGDAASRHIEEVARSAAETAPALILLDLNLPKTDGHELLKLIRSKENLANIPVVIITSSDAAKDRRRAAEHGASDYFKKPFDFDEFLTLGSVVKRFLEQPEGILL